MSQKYTVTISLRLTEEMALALEERAKQLYRDRTDLIREAIGAHLKLPGFDHEDRLQTLEAEQALTQKQLRVLDQLTSRLDDLELEMAAKFAEDRADIVTQLGKIVAQLKLR